LKPVIEKKELIGASLPKKSVLFIYNGSVRGKLSGGEYVYGEIRSILKSNFIVRELVLDDLLLNVPLVVRRVMKRVGLAT